MKSISIVRLIIFCFVIQLFSSCSIIFSNRRDVYQNMYEIKKSRTLVKLKSANNKIEWLIKNGDETAAKELELKIAKENEEIIKAVNDHYTFSEYYFISSEDFILLGKEEFKDLKLLDIQMNPVDGLFLSDRNFYVLSFDGVYGSPRWEIVDGKRVPSGGNEWYPGIATLDSDLIQIKKPFPQLGLPQYKYNLTSFEWKVKSYNTELENWYYSNRSRINKFAK